MSVEPFPKPMTCQCTGCVKCYDVRADCQRAAMVNEDWCWHCSVEYVRVLRAVFAEAMEAGA